MHIDLDGKGFEFKSERSYSRLEEFSPYLVVKMHSDRFGYVIVEGANRDESISRANEALYLLNIETNQEIF